MPDQNQKNDLIHKACFDLDDRLGSLYESIHDEEVEDSFDPVLPETFTTDKDVFHQHALHVALRNQLRNVLFQAVLDFFEVAMVGTRLVLRSHGMILAIVAVLYVYGVKRHNAHVDHGVENGV